MNTYKPGEGGGGIGHVHYRVTIFLIAPSLNLLNIGTSFFIAYLLLLFSVDVLENYQQDIIIDYLRRKDKKRFSKRGYFHDRDVEAI